MPLTMDMTRRQQREYSCTCCNSAIERVWNSIYRDDQPVAVYYASCYHHVDQDHDAYLDIIMGTWGVEGVNDHVTFGCRVGPVVNSPAPAATMVQACQDGSAGELHGKVLSREEGLAHPWVRQFWELVDFVLEHDPTVCRHLYGRADG